MGLGAVVEAPVAMLQHGGEFSSLLALYLARQPRRVLEIGAGEGGSLYHWLSRAEPGSVVVAVDDRHVNAASYLQWCAEGVEVVTIYGRSAEAETYAKAARLAPFDWIFIDADHHDAAVRKDWALYRKLAAPGSVVALHDITPSADPSVEVAGLWAELRAEHETVEIVRPHGFGIGVVFVPEKHADFQGFFRHGEAK